MALTNPCMRSRYRERHTDYRGFTATDSVVQWFWEVNWPPSFDGFQPFCGKLTLALDIHLDG